MSLAVVGWLADRHYRPLLDTASSDLAIAKLARDNLETLAGEEGRKLGKLVAESDERARRADQAVADAKELAKPDYAAANRLLQERFGGILLRLLLRSLIRSWGYEAVGEWVGSDSGGMRRS